MDLADIATDDLLAEVQRRMHCMDKPEKRVIMVGKHSFLSCKYGSTSFSIRSNRC